MILRLLIIFLGASFYLTSQETKATPHVPPIVASGDQKDVIVIDPKERSQDFIEAYEIMKKGKSPQNIFFHLSNGKTISNVSEMSLTKNGTLVLLKVATSMGMKIELVPIENLISITQL